MTVGVLGTTEYGTFDPVDRVLAARERAVARGLGHSVHVDAAWGSLFWPPCSAMRTAACAVARRR